MTIAQGINKTVAYKKQSGLGVAASGAGATLLRRVTANINLTKDSYENNEIVSHQQSTGSTYGIAKSQGTLSGLLSCTTWMPFLGSLVRKDPAATAAISGLTITIATSGSNYTLTRSAGSWLTDGVKVYDVGQLSGGSFNANNVSKNVVVLSMTATVLTVNVLNSASTMTAEGPIATATFTVTGKKTWAQLSGFNNDYYTFEDYYPDIATRSHLWPDIQIGSVDIAMPATGNVTASFALVGLGGKTESGAQVLTSPAAAPTTAVFGSVAGAAYIGATRYTNITSFSLKIDGTVSQGEATIGSNTIADVQRGRIKVSGSFSYLYDADTIGANFLNETTVALAVVLADSRTAGANTMAFFMPQAKLFSNDVDDGEKQLIRTVNFTAEIPSTGGAALANWQAIISIQDSLAP